MTQRIIALAYSLQDGELCLPLFTSTFINFIHCLGMTKTEKELDDYQKKYAVR